MAVEVEVPRRLFTVDEYHWMADVGILGEDERVELIEGEIIQMAPIGPSHAGSVINATRLFIIRLGDRAVVSPQNPVVTSVTLYGPDQTVSPLAFPDVSFAVSDFFA